MYTDRNKYVNTNKVISSRNIFVPCKYSPSFIASHYTGADASRIGHRVRDKILLINTRK